jgi:hypothetical protein
MGLSHFGSGLLQGVKPFPDRGPEKKQNPSDSHHLLPRLKDTVIVPVQNGLVAFEPQDLRQLFGCQVFAFDFSYKITAHKISLRLLHSQQSPAKGLGRFDGNRVPDLFDFFRFGPAEMINGLDGFHQHTSFDLEI